MTRAVLVTGASTGIGRACAEALAGQGFQVYAGVRKQSDADTLDQLGVAGLEPVTLDVTKAADIEQVAAHVTGSGHELAAIVNNAGVVEAGPLECLPLDRLRWQLEVNVTGQVAVTQAFLPLLRRSQGRIIFIGSSSGYMTAPFVGAYCASKHAIEAIADALRQELRPWGIHVANVQPGAIATPIWDKSTDTADAMLAGWTETEQALYGPVVDKMRGLVSRQSSNASPVSTVVQAVQHAITARRPRTRYRVGKDAGQQWVLSRFVPDRLRDWLVRLSTGI